MTENMDAPDVEEGHHTEHEEAPLIDIDGDGTCDATDDDEHRHEARCQDV